MGQADPFCFRTRADPAWTYAEARGRRSVPGPPGQRSVGRRGAISLYFVLTSDLI